MSLANSLPLIKSEAGAPSAHAAMLVAPAPCAAPQQHAWNLMVHPRGEDILARPRKTIVKGGEAGGKGGRRRGREPQGSKGFSWVMLQPPPEKVGAPPAVASASAEPSPKPPKEKKLRGHAGFSWRPL
jgi:hypothetical protein